MLVQWAGSLLPDSMPRFKPYDYGQDLMVPINLEEQLIEGVLSLELDHVDLELLHGGRGLSPELVEPWVRDAPGGLPHVDELSGAAPICASG